MLRGLLEASKTYRTLAKESVILLDDICFSNRMRLGRIMSSICFPLSSFINLINSMKLFKSLETLVELAFLFLQVIKFELQKLEFETIQGKLPKASLLWSMKNIQRRRASQRAPAAGA